MTKIRVSSGWTESERSKVAAQIRNELQALAGREPAWVIAGSYPDQPRTRGYRARKHELEVALQFVEGASAEFLEDNRKNYSDWIE